MVIPVGVQGQIALIVELRYVSYQRRTIVDLPPSYSTILGRSILHKLKVAISIYHYCMNFPYPSGVRIVRKDQTKAR